MRIVAEKFLASREAGYKHANMAWTPGIIAPIDDAVAAFCSPFSLVLLCPSFRPSLPLNMLQNSRWSMPMQSFLYTFRTPHPSSYHS
jgi:hypothetical protein